MARSARPEGFSTTLRERRQAAGLTQKELARRVGLTRQALLRVEAGDFLPNTAVSLRLAEVLGCRVEELFALDQVAAGEELVLPEDPGPGRGRVLLARVGERLVGYPATPSRPVASGFGPADALLREGGAPELLVPASVLERTALVLGCDPALSLLRAHLSRLPGGCRAHTVPASSQRALDALARGHAHVAGTHMVTAEGFPDLDPARAALEGCGGKVVTFAAWDQGLVLAPGNPKGIRTLADLTRPDVTIVNRAPGTGSRILLDAALARDGIPPSAVSGVSREVASHGEVCQAVLLGLADAGVAVAPLAVEAGLDFLPLGEVRFDLVVRADAADHPAVGALLDLLGEPLFQKELGALPSYGIRRTGAVAEEVAER